MDQEQFWLKNPYVLLDKKYICNIAILSQQTTLNSKLNSMTRLIILLTVFGYVFTKNIRIIISGIIAIVCIILLHQYLAKQEGMQLTRSNYGILTDDFKKQANTLESSPIIDQDYTMPTQNNPLMNVLLPEIQYNKNRKEAAPSFNPRIEEDINLKSKKNLDPRLFQDLGDQLEYEYSMNRFYTTANTMVSNNQSAFADFCYGESPSCKEGDGLQCEKKNYRHILS